MILLVEVLDPIQVRPRADLERVPDAAIAIGEAPDGLPLVPRVARSRDARSAIRRVLGRGDDDLPSDVVSAIATLQRLVTRQTLRDGLDGNMYTASRPIGALLGASLLANALGEAGPLADAPALLHRRAARRCAAGVGPRGSPWIRLKKKRRDPREPRRFPRFSPSRKCSVTPRSPPSTRLRPPKEAVRSARNEPRRPRRPRR